MTSVEKVLPTLFTGAVMNGPFPSLQYCTVTRPGELTVPSIWKIRLLLASCVAVMPVTIEVVTAAALSKAALPGIKPGEAGGGVVDVLGEDELEDLAQPAMRKSETRRMAIAGMNTCLVLIEIRFIACLIKLTY